MTKEQLMDIVKILEEEVTDQTIYLNKWEWDNYKKSGMNMEMFSLLGAIKLPLSGPKSYDMVKRLRRIGKNH